MSTSVPVNEIPEDFNGWEQFSLKASLLLTTVKNLDDLQAKVREAELSALRSLSKKDLSPEFLAQSGK